MYGPRLQVFKYFLKETCAKDGGQTYTEYTTTIDCGEVRWLCRQLTGQTGRCCSLAAVTRTTSTRACGHAHAGKFMQKLTCKLLCRKLSPSWVHFRLFIGACCRPETGNAAVRAAQPLKTDPSLTILTNCNDWPADTFFRRENGKLLYLPNP